MDLGKLNNEKIDRLVEVNIAGHDLEHVGFYWTEGSTEDGNDTWLGWLCPRCGISGDPDEGSPEPCIKRYTLSLDTVLKFLDDTDHYIQITYHVYGHAEADYWNGKEHYYGYGKRPARAVCEAILRACGELRQEPQKGG